MPEDQVQVGIAWLTGAFGVGAAAGFGLSGPLAATVGWRWIFWLGAAMVLAGLTFVRVLVPESDVRTGARTDVPGAALSAGLVGLLVAMTVGPSSGWMSPLVLGTGSGRAVVLAVWVWRELHVEEPLLGPAILMPRPLLLANSATAAAGFVAFVVLWTTCGRHDRRCYGACDPARPHRRSQGETPGPGKWGRLTAYLAGSGKPYVDRVWAGNRSELPRRR